MDKDVRGGSQILVRSVIYVWRKFDFRSGVVLKRCFEGSGCLAWTRAWTWFGVSCFDLIASAKVLARALLIFHKGVLACYCCDLCYHLVPAFVGDDAVSCKVKLNDGLGYGRY